MNKISVLIKEHTNEDTVRREPAKGQEEVPPPDSKSPSDLILDYQPPDYEKQISVIYKPPNLWYPELRQESREDPHPIPPELHLPILLSSNSNLSRMFESRSGRKGYSSER